MAEQTDRLRTILEADITAYARNMSRAASVMEGFGTVAKLVAGAFAGKKLFEGFSGIVEAADESEAAQRKLAQALSNTGQLSAETVAAFDEQAAAMQAMTTLDDDAVTGQQALAVALGATAREALDLVPAAADLSAAVGIGLDEATRALTLSLDGNIGMLGRYVPAVRDMTDAQLAAGAAVDLVAQSFGGFAGQEAQTLTGAMTQMRNAFGNMLEELGKTITQNENVRKAVETVTKVFHILEKGITDNRDEIGKFVTRTMSGLIKSFGYMISILGDAVKAWSNLWGTLGQATLAFERWNLEAAEKTKIPEVIADHKEYVRWLEEAVRSQALAANEAETFRQIAHQMGAEIAYLGDQMIDADAGTATLTKSFTALNAESGNVATQVGAISTSLDDLASGLSLKGKGFAFKVDLLFPEMAEIQKQFGGGGKFGAAMPVTLEMPDTSFVSEAIAKPMADSIIEAIGQGLNALQSGIGSTISTAIIFLSEIFEEELESLAEGMADTIQKIAPIVGAVLDMLANFTPESLDKTIKGFMEGFVSALSNIGPAIAVLIDNLDEIAIGIVQAVIGLLAGIVANIPNFIGAILNTALELITQIVPRVIGTLRDVFRMAGQVMKIIWSDLASHVTGILTTLGNGLTSFFDSFLDFEEIQQTWAGAVARGIRDFFAVTVSDALSKFGTFMSGVFSSVVGFFKGIVNWFFGLFNKIIDGLNEIPGVNIPHIPALHSGGIVPGPAGQEVPIMALGGERIVPMDEAQEGGGWGRAINITINEARSPGETVDALVQALKMGVRTNRIHPMVLA